MGLKDDIMTLEAKYRKCKPVGQDLLQSYAEMIVRKNSKRLIWYWFDLFKKVLQLEHRYQELVEVADGVDPQEFGAWDLQEAVGIWLAKQGERSE